MHGRAVLALSALAFCAPAAADDAVVVIRGSNVSVARPLTPERVRDGSAEVEIVRVEAAPAPPERPRRTEPEREIVVVLLPSAEPAPPVGIPVVWTPAWPWWPWNPGPPQWRAGSPRRGHFLPGLHLPGPRGALRSGLRSR
jgi:hypothetical protein